MTRRLPQHPAQYFIDKVLLPEWQPSGAIGYDPTLSDPSADGFVPVGESLDDVGEVYPSLTVQRTNETAGGDSGYDFMTTDGPGQNRDGQLLVTARAQEERDYSGGSQPAVDAGEIAGTLVDEVEDVTIRRATAPNTEFSFVSAFPAADAPDDFDVTPTVRIEQTVVQYAWIRD